MLVVIARLHLRHEMNPHQQVANIERAGDFLNRDSLCFGEEGQQVEQTNEPRIVRGE